jgi:hypothetical protein
MFVDGKALVSPTCPAAENGCDITSHDFRFVAYDAAEVPNGPRNQTEVFGYFQPAGLGDEEWSEEVVETPEFTVPKDSPISRIAHEIQSDPSGDKAHITGEHLRRAVMECPCTDTTECPALNFINLLQAMEKATGKS